MDQIKKLLVFIIAMTILVILLFMINDQKGDTEYSDVFFGQAPAQDSPVDIHS